MSRDLFQGPSYWLPQTKSQLTKDTLPTVYRTALYVPKHTRSTIKPLEHISIQIEKLAAYVLKMPINLTAHLGDVSTPSKT